MKITFLISVAETIILLVSLAHVASATCSSQDLMQSELIFTTDSTTEQTGSITLKCRDGFTAEEVKISEIKFFLNHSSPSDPCLRERGDITVVEVGSTGIKFNLTREYDGYYTCRKRVDCAYVKESMPKALICKCMVIIIQVMQQNYFLLYYSTSDHHSTVAFFSD